MKNEEQLKNQQHRGPDKAESLREEGIIEGSKSSTLLEQLDAGKISKTITRAALSRKFINMQIAGYEINTVKSVLASNKCVVDQLHALLLEASPKCCTLTDSKRKSRAFVSDQLPMEILEEHVPIRPRYSSLKPTASKNLY